MVYLRLLSSPGRRESLSLGFAHNGFLPRFVLQLKVTKPSWETGTSFSLKKKPVVKQGTSSVLSSSVLLLISPMYNIPSALNLMPVYGWSIIFYLSGLC